MAEIIYDPQVTVNDDLWAVVANSVSYTSGAGERSVKAAGTGGGKGELHISENVETKISTAKLAVFTTVDNEDFVDRAIKRKSANVLVITGTDNLGNSIRKVFTNAIITNDPEFNLKSDGQIDIEFMSDPAV